VAGCAGALKAMGLNSFRKVSYLHSYILREMYSFLGYLIDTLRGPSLNYIYLELAFYGHAIVGFLLKIYL